MKRESDIDKRADIIDAIKEVLLFMKNKTLEDLKLDRILSLAVIKEYPI